MGSRQPIKPVDSVRKLIKNHSAEEKLNGAFYFWTEVHEGLVSQERKIKERTIKHDNI